MTSRLLLLLATATCVAAFEPAVKLVSFDGTASDWKWHVLNDPVMGGRSHSTFSVDTATNKSVTWVGVTEIVPSLKAPGFCNLETKDAHRTAADASAQSHLLIYARTSTPEYAGYKISFAADTNDPQFKSFKTEFNATREWSTIALPWSAFSNDWSEYTGRCDTTDPTGRTHKCSAAHPEVCPTKHNLKGISQFGIWTEGVAGAFD